MTVRIFVGCAANNEDLESQAALEYSLRKHVSLPIEIEWMQQSRERGSFWHGWNTSAWATPFSGFRWGVPARCNFEGRAIYMDSDMIVMADIAELWKQALPPHGGAMIARSRDRYCVTLFDCARVKPYMLPIERLKSEALAYRTQRHAIPPRAVQTFVGGNWNCLDGENYADLSHPDIKCIHYTAIPTQPQLPRALVRLKAQGLTHWFAGEPRPHPRRDLSELFEKTLREAIDAGFKPENYEKPPFGDYVGCHGGGWAKRAPAKSMRKAIPAGAWMTT